MKDPGERGLPDELEPIAARLQAERAQGDPLQLDQIKRRVMARGSADKRRSTFMRSRILTIFTTLALVGGTGGAIAVGETGSHAGPNGGAASGEYPGKGCGDMNHTHTGPPGNPGNTSCPPQSQHSGGGTGGVAHSASSNRSRRHHREHNRRHDRKHH
jgi:hypothetical protein